MQRLKNSNVHLVSSLSLSIINHELATAQSGFPSQILYIPSFIDTSHFYRKGISPMTKKLISLQYNYISYLICDSSALCSFSCGKIFQEGCLKIASFGRFSVLLKTNSYTWVVENVLNVDCKSRHVYWKWSEEQV